MLTHRQFITAGNCTFTIQSKKTGAHFTFEVKEPKRAKGVDCDPNAPRFVRLMTGPDNNHSFSYLGTIFADGNFRITRNSKVAQDAPGAQAFSWLWRNVDALPACACCRCGRKLTNPLSVEMAIGPECAGKLGM